MLSMLTEEQIKMARAALGWSVSDLAKNSSVGARTINRIESEGGLAVATQANIKLIVTTLEAAGIEFIGSPGDGPGVRLWTKIP
jgi:ribosome-binding protein aMBF1 (putative translation factor)